MEQPNVETKLLDKRNNILYIVLAYRKLTEQEMHQQIALFYRDTKKKIKKNSKYIIQTIIGYDEPVNPFHR